MKLDYWKDNLHLHNMYCYLTLQVYSEHCNCYKVDNNYELLVDLVVDKHKDLNQIFGVVVAVRNIDYSNHTIVAAAGCNC